MSYLSTGLDKGFVTRWLVSETYRRKLEAEPRSILEESNVWAGSTEARTHVNPLKELFLKEAEAVEDVCPELCDLQPGGKVAYQGKELRLDCLFSYDDPFVNVSTFDPTPSFMAVVAVAGLTAEEAGDVEAEAEIKGGFTLFLNGRKVQHARPEVRNEGIVTGFTLPLSKGLNIVAVVMDELAERDTDLTFSLRLSSPVLQTLPIGDRDEEKVKAVERAMGTLCFERTCFTSGHVRMEVDSPFSEKPFTLSLIGATEENAALGILKASDVTFPGGSTSADLGPVEDFPVGYLRCRLTAFSEGMRISVVRAFENFPFSFLDKPLPTVKERKRQALEFLAKHGEGNTNRALALLFTGGDKDLIESILQEEIGFINRRSDCSDFYLSYFPYIIRHFSSTGQVRPETLSKMKECILGFRYWHDEPGTDGMWFWSENHALMFHVCQLVAGELYPDEVFTNSGMTGREMQRKAKRMLREWFSVFFKIGFTEWNSPPYLPIDVLGFGSLYAQTEDEELKGYAKRALDYVFRLLSIASFEGIFSTTSGRTYPKELMGNYSNCPSFINWIGYGIGNQSHAGKGSVPLCLSDYEPDPANLRYHRLEPGKALWWKSTHGYNGYADVTVYKTSSYLLSAADSFNPGRRGFQEDVIHCVMGAEEHVWINHPGEHAPFGQARPSCWAGSGTLPEAVQYKGFAAVTFSISEEHPVDYTHAYFPVYSFVRVMNEGPWWFAETHSGAFLALWAENGLELVKSGPFKRRELRSPGRRNIYIMRLAEKRAEGSLERYAAKILSTPLVSGSGSWCFLDWEYGLLSGGWMKGLSVNGEAEVYKGWGHEGKIVIENLKA